MMLAMDSNRRIAKVLRKCSRMLGAILSFASCYAHAERKALVVGNDHYTAVVRLANAGHDASSMAGALKNLGYDTTLVLDANRLKMSSAIERFAESLKPGDIVLFYYAGHGMQVDGENYLIPTDFTVTNASAGKEEGYSLSKVLSLLENHGATTRIVVLDACRDNPFLGTRSLHGGWAGVSTTAGTFLAFGTSPGSTAADSPNRGHGAFTQALLKYLPTSNLDIYGTFERVRQEVIVSTDGHQVPWIASNLIGQLHLNPAQDQSSAPVPSARDVVALLAKQSVLTSRNSAPRSLGAASDRLLLQRTLPMADTGNSYNRSRDEAAAVRSDPRSGVSVTAAPDASTDSEVTTASDLNQDAVAAALLTESVQELSAERYDSAQRGLEALLALDPRAELVARLLSLTLGWLGHRQEALKVIDRSLVDHPNSALLLHDRCIEETDMDATQAIEDCKLALSIKPTLSDGHNALAAAYLAAGSLQLASKEINAASNAGESSDLNTELQSQVNSVEALNK
jgi:uncharacterized caspase-like protein